jgi:diadenosine tetraphosphate (Ap4A) HIT family hydrolase
MKNRQLSGAAIFKDEMFSLEQSTECPIPGYLILRMKGEATSLVQLPAETAKALGEMLARAAKAIETAVGAERVYVLSFCEVDHRLHFHLFPRSAWLLKEYFKANDCANDPVNGPMLFEWARNAFGPGSRMPKGTTDMASVSAILRGILG